MDGERFWPKLVGSEEEVRKERKEWEEGVRKGVWKSYGEFFTSPLLLFLSFLLFSLFLYYLLVWREKKELSTRENFKEGFFFAILLYLLLCAFSLKDSVILRPHPMFWRMVKGATFLYTAGLVFLLFLVTAPL